MDWRGKVVVITGASSGIGAETARLVAERGAVPVLLARRKEKLEEIQRSIAASGKVQAHAIAIWTLDVSDSIAVERVFGEIGSKFGTVDVLINNAGFGLFRSFSEMPPEEFREMMDVNYMGIVLCTKAALPLMLRQSSGHIVNVASVAGKIATKKTAGYSATKHAVIGLSNALRMELQGSGVYVSTVNPGPIATSFFERADPNGEYMKNLGKMKGVVLRPEQVAVQILRAVEQKKAEITLPWFAAFGVKLAHLFPRLFERITARLLDKK